MDLLTLLFATLIASAIGFMWKTFAAWIGGIEPIRAAILSLVTHPSPHDSWRQIYNSTVTKLSDTRTFLRFVAPIPLVSALLIILICFLGFFLSLVWKSPVIDMIGHILGFYAVMYVITAISSPVKFVLAFTFYAIIYVVFLTISIYLMRLSRIVGDFKSLIAYSVLSSVVLVILLFLIYAMLIAAFIHDVSIGEMAERFLEAFRPSDETIRFTYFFSTEYFESLEILHKTSDDDDVLGTLIFGAMVGIGGTLYLFFAVISTTILFFLGYYIGVIALSIDLWLRRRLKVSIRRIEDDPVDYFARLVAVSSFVSVIPLLVTLTALIRGLRGLGY
jgi:hypothetical protein